MLPVDAEVYCKMCLKAWPTLLIILACISARKLWINPLKNNSFVSKGLDVWISRKVCIMLSRTKTPLLIKLKEVLGFFFQNSFETISSLCSDRYISLWISGITPEFNTLCCEDCESYYTFWVVRKLSIPQEILAACCLCCIWLKVFIRSVSRKSLCAHCCTEAGA